MNRLNIAVTVGSLASLKNVGTNTYEIALHFLDGNGNAIVNANLPTTPYIATVVTTSTSFVVKVPITQETYTINDVTVKAYGNGNNVECCSDTLEYDIVNTKTPSITNQAVIVNSLSNGNIYSYEPSSNALTLLFASAEPSFDIAHTANKLWVYHTLFVESVPKSRIYEYNITLNPFTQVAGNTYDVALATDGPGLCASSNTQLFMAGTRMTEINISGTTATETVLFTLANLYRCTGDLIYDSNTQLFIMSYHNSNIPDYRIGVFNRSGTIIRSAVAPTESIFGIYQYLGTTYVIAGNGDTYTLNLTTLATTPVGNIGASIAGASQIPGQISIPA